MMLKFSVFCFLFLFSGTTGTAWAQLNDLKFERITIENGLPQNTIHGIVKDKYGFMWFGTWGGLCRYDGYSFKIYKYDRSNLRSINNNQIHNVVKDANQDVWVLTFKNDEICRYNYKTDDFERVPVGKVSPELLQFLSRRSHYKSLKYIYKDQRWDIDTTTNTLVQTNIKTGERKVYQADLSNRWALSDPYVTDIYLDDQNVLWVGTYSNGINKANLDAKPFEYYYSNPSRSNSIIDNNVRTISEDKSGNLWIGTRDKGITIISGTKAKHISAGFSENTIPDNHIKVLFCDSRGLTWIGTRNGLTNFDPRNGTFTRFNTLGLNYTTVYSIAEDRKGDLWFATWLGLYKYISSEKRVKHFDPDKTLLSKHARVVIADQTGLIWVGTEGGGVTVLKAAAGDTLVHVRHLIHRNNDANAIIDDRINCLYQDSEGLIWIGTGNGLDRYNPRTKRFLHLPAKTGLNEIIVAGIIEDDNGSLWISHKTGIVKLNKQNLAVRHYTLKDGLQSNEFANGAVLKSVFTNKLYFGGNNGFNAFYPDSIKTEKTIPKTVITGLQILNHAVGINQEVNGRVVLQQPLYLTDKIELNYDDKAVSFSFSALHYSNSQGNKYAYMLEGFDADWVYTNAGNRLASYSNLNPGKYLFKVKSSNSDGVWNTQPATLALVVNPPLWASTWAYIFYFLLLFAAVYAYHFYSNRYSRLRAKLDYELLIKEKEKDLQHSKLQFFTNISHEIKTPLSLILAPLEKLGRHFSHDKAASSEIDTMKQNGNRLLKLLNQLLDFRKMETGNLSIHKSEADIVVFLSDFVKTFIPLAEQKEIELRFIHDADCFVFAYDQEMLEKVMANLLSNAFKFTTRSAWIKIHLKKQDESVVIEVTNLGKLILDDDRQKIFEPFVQGSDHKIEGTGLGLAFSKGIVSLHGGEISIISKPAEEGLAETTFKVELPVNNTDQSSGIFNNLVPASIEPENHQDFSNQADKANHVDEVILINGRPPVLLIVEDNDDLRSYLKAHFEKNYEVLEAEDGLAGQELASQAFPDLVISDVMMPGIDGFELCRRLKSESLTNHIPIILLTAKTPLEYQIEGVEVGADDYILKPFNIVLLSLKIRNLLLVRIRLQEKFKSKVTIQPSAINPQSPDEKLLKKLLTYIEERISDPDLIMDDICTDIGLSRTQLYRKIKAMTGLGVAEMIKEIRLNRAQQLLRDTTFNVGEVAYMVGFAEADYFRKCFKAQFGITPSEYAKNQFKGDR